jgi:hypothetical protein
VFIFYLRRDGGIYASASGIRLHGLIECDFSRFVTGSLPASRFCVFPGQRHSRIAGKGRENAG